MNSEGQTPPESIGRRILRGIFGEDVFVSYSRADGLRYAAALANELTRRGFACRIDQYDTLPGVEIPERVRRSIRNCRMMVVVASERAWVSARVEQEVVEFLRPPLRGQLLLVCFGDTPATALWHQRVLGLPLNQERPDTLGEGAPTPSLVDLVANSFQFRRRNRRLLHVFVGLMIAVGLTVAIGLYAVNRIGVQLSQVSTERDRAFSDRTRAVTERDQASSERNRLDAENATQRLALETTTNERDRVMKDLGVQQAEVTRQTGLNAALQSMGDEEVRRRSRGYSSPADLLALLEASATLRASGRRAEAQAALADALVLQPRLKATIPSEGGVRTARAIAAGQRLVIGGTSTRIWDLDAGREVAALPEQATWTAASADGGRFLTVTRAGDFVVRDARSLAVISRWSCRLSAQSPAFALSPDGFEAIATCEGSMRLFKVATGAVLTTIPQGGHVSDVRLGVTGGMVAVINGAADLRNRISLFSATDGNPVEGGRCVAPDRAYLVDPSARRIARGCDDGSISNDSDACATYVCGISEKEAFFTIPTQARTRAAFSRDGQHLALEEGGVVRVWRPADRMLLTTLSRSLPSRELRFSHDGSRLAGAADGLIWVADARTAELSLMIDAPGTPELVATSANGAIVVTSTSASGPLHLWEAALPRPLVVEFGGAASDASFSPDSRYLIAMGKQVRGSDVDWYRVIDRASGAQALRVTADADDDEDPPRSTRKLDALRSSGSNAAEIEALQRSLPARGSFKVTDGGRLAIVQSGLEITLWDLRKRAPIAIKERVTWRSQPVLTTDGRYLMARGSSVVDLQTRHVVFTSDRPVLAVSRSGMAATGEFGLVQIWRMDTRALEARIRVDGQPMGGSFSPDEKEIAIAAGSLVQLWRWRLDDLMETSCRLIDANRAAAPWASLAIAASYRRICGSTVTTR